MRRVSPPVHPAEGGVLDVVDCAPGALSWSSDQLGLEQRVHGLGEGVVVGVADGADRGDRADVVACGRAFTGCRGRTGSVTAALSSLVDGAVVRWEGLGQ